MRTSTEARLTTKSIKAIKEQMKITSGKPSHQVNFEIIHIFPRVKPSFIVLKIALMKILQKSLLRDFLF